MQHNRVDGADRYVPQLPKVRTTHRKSKLLLPMFSERYSYSRRRFLSCKHSRKKLEKIIPVPSGGMKLEPSYSRLGL